MEAIVLFIGLGLIAIGFYCYIHTPSGKKWFESLD